MNYDQEYYYERMAETYAGLTGFRRTGGPALRPRGTDRRGPSGGVSRDRIRQDA